MDLDPQIAEAIVTDLKDIIKHEINLFDTTGTIIASTDRSRIGTGHDGARKVIQTHETISIDNDDEYQGARHGINVPVLFNDSVVAVIGITGERKEVEPFGNVIKKMTEILIRENWEKISRFDRRERLSDLVRALSNSKHDSSFTQYLAAVLEIDLSRPRRAVVGMMPTALDSPTPSSSRESLYDSLYLRFQALKHSFFSLSTTEICMFIDNEDEWTLPTLLTNIRADTSVRLQHEAVFGIGTVYSDSDEYWRSYREARRACEWSLFSGTGPVIRYEDLDYGIFLSSIPSEDAKRLSERVFGNLTEKEIDEYRELFDAYTRHNGSIVHCAEELFLHKNTLQNRLNRLAAKTGYNPRKLADYAVLSIAFKLRDYNFTQYPH